MARLTANEKAKKYLTNDGFSPKMIHVVELLTTASSHRTLSHWVKWFRRLQPDESMNVELDIIKLTFHKYGKTAFKK